MTKTTGLARVRIVELLVVVPTILLILVLFARTPIPPDQMWLDWIVWLGVIALVELMPVPAWRGLTISVGFPVMIAVAILYPPGVAGLIALLVPPIHESSRGRCHWMSPSSTEPKLPSRWSPPARHSMLSRLIWTPAVSGCSLLA